MALRLLLLGPQGAGKGTQAERIAKLRDIPHIATGDMFRQAVREGTPLGLEAQGYMQRGDLVPDEVTIGIVRERLDKDDAQSGFILDGFPRTAAQAQALEEILAEMERPLTAVVELAVQDDLLLKRLGGRRVCLKCGRTYHVDFDPPKVDGVCDDCGGEVVQRADDADDRAILRRLQLYREQTLPLAEYYRVKGLLHLVDGGGRPDDVMAAILAAAGSESGGGRS